MCSAKDAQKKYLNLQENPPRRWNFLAESSRSLPIALPPHFPITLLASQLYLKYFLEISQKVQSNLKYLLTFWPTRPKAFPGCALESQVCFEITLRLKWFELLKIIFFTVRANSFATVCFEIWRRKEKCIGMGSV